MGGRSQKKNPLRSPKKKTCSRKILFLEKTESRIKGDVAFFSGLAGKNLSINEPIQVMVSPWFFTGFQPASCSACKAAEVRASEDLMVEKGGCWYRIGWCVDQFNYQVVVIKGEYPVLRTSSNTSKDVSTLRFHLDASGSKSWRKNIHLKVLLKQSQHMATSTCTDAVCESKEYLWKPNDGNSAVFNTSCNGWWLVFPLGYSIKIQIAISLLIKSNMHKLPSRTNTPRSSKSSTRSTVPWTS